MLKMKRLALAFCCFSLLVATAAAQDSMSGGQMMKKSLYERLGGEDALKGVVMM